MRGLTGTADLVGLSFESAAAPGLPHSVLQRLARYTLDVNPRLGLTGELRLEGRRFALTLEGRAEVVLPLAARIFADRRHAAIRLAGFGAIPGRSFVAWRTTGFGLDDVEVPDGAAALRFAAPGLGRSAARALGARTL